MSGSTNEYSKCLKIDPTGVDCGEDGLMENWDVSAITSFTNRYKVLDASYSYYDVYSEHDDAYVPEG